jgi:hypothetical protein
VLGTCGELVHHEKVFFLKESIIIPQDYYLVHLMRAVKAKEREAFAKHLAEADGGANCIMTSTSCGSTDITSIIGNRKAAFAAELAVTGKEQGQRVFLKSAKLM